jgi:hypothetical protein
MVPPDSTGISRVPAYSGARPLSYSDFAYGTLTPSGPPFQAPSAILSVRFRQVPQPRSIVKCRGLGSSQFARRYYGNLLLDFSSSGYLDVSVPRVRSPLLTKQGDRISPAGFPHSDISGSTLACSSPKLFAACHVLHRRSVPRHPPCALLSLDQLCHPSASPVSLSIFTSTLTFSLLARIRHDRSAASRPPAPATHAQPSVHSLFSLSLHPRAPGSFALSVRLTPGLLPQGSTPLPDPPGTSVKKLGPGQFQGQDRIGKKKPES